MIIKDNIIKIFCSVDDFCQEFVPYWEKHLVSSGKKRIQKILIYSFQHKGEFQQKTTYKSLIR